MNTTAKKILNISLKVATWLIVAFTIFMMIFTIVTVTTVDRHDRSIFGMKFYIVRTDSMSLSDKNKDMKVHFNAGDIVIIKSVKDRTALQPNNIIAFMSTNSKNYGETVTHMIRKVQKNDEGKVIGYVTYGTNTGADDEALVEPAYVLGIYSGKLPAIGKLFAFVKTTSGYITCILVPFLLLILYNGMNVVRLFRKYRHEQMEAMQIERDKLEAERAETQRMMKELLALKAQLDKIDGGRGTISAEPASEAPLTEKVTTVETEESPSKTTDENQ